MGLQAALLEAYRTHVTWEFPARDELRTRAYLFTAAAIYCAMVALLTRVRGRARIAYMAGVIHSIAAGSYMLMVRGDGVSVCKGRKGKADRAAAPPPKHGIHTTQNTNIELQHGAPDRDRQARPAERRYPHRGVERDGALPPLPRRCVKSLFVCRADNRCTFIIHSSEPIY